MPAGFILSRSTPESCCARRKSASRVRCVRRVPNWFQKKNRIPMLPMMLASLVSIIRMIGGSFLNFGHPQCAQNLHFGPSRALGLVFKKVCAYDFLVWSREILKSFRNPSVARVEAGAWSPKWKSADALPCGLRRQQYGQIVTG